MAKAKRRTPGKPRDPYARNLVTRRGGAHGKSRRALRKAANDALKKSPLDA